MNHPLVNSKWLSQNLEKVTLLHVTMVNPVNGKAGELSDVYIPTSLSFDFEKKICDLSSPLPHTMPSSQQFTQNVQALGINSESTVVVYDDVGIFSAPRVWWMLKSMGHQHVYVLDGGLPAWIDQGFEVTSQLRQPNGGGDFVAAPIPESLFNAQQVVGSIDIAEHQIIDARSSARFHGMVAEPREGLRSGHIPNSINLPFTKLIKEGHFIDYEELNNVFTQHGIDKNKRIITSCGSGVTATIILLAADILGFNFLSLYDGSWSEWGANKALPITNC
ncbi:sulfurtransferase [Aliivibrio kagoshimensis]|uniref:sulfurtransferase n=1 Tax=Aliivibrio kagoshimensis TaxID=2910230 RepID=UPI003D0D7C75